MTETTTTTTNFACLDLNARPCGDDPQTALEPPRDPHPRGRTMTKTMTTTDLACLNLDSLADDDDRLAAHERLRETLIREAGR